MQHNYKNKKGRLIGVLDPEGEKFSKTVSRKKHFMRKLGAWAIDREVVIDLVKRGVKKIEIKEKESGVTYSTNPQEFLDNSILADYGHGEQLFLEETYFSRN